MHSAIPSSNELYGDYLRFQCIAQRVRFIFSQTFCQIFCVEAIAHAMPEQWQNPCEEQLRQRIDTFAWIANLGLFTRIHVDESIKLSSEFVVRLEIRTEIMENANQ